MYIIELNYYELHLVDENFANNFLNENQNGLYTY